MSLLLFHYDAGPHGRFQKVLLLLALVLPGLCASMPASARMAMPMADRIVVLKSERVLLLEQNGHVLQSFPIALGPHPIGTKRARGDGRTPEGTYTIDDRNPHSHYHLALHISYPNATDQARASARHVDPGGDIFIHGVPEWYGHRDPRRFYKDWTQGCISVGNIAIEQIWSAVHDGTPIEIRP